MAGDGEWVYEEIVKNMNGTSRRIMVNAGSLILGLCGPLAI